MSRNKIRLRWNTKMVDSLNKTLCALLSWILGWLLSRPGIWAAQVQASVDSILHHLADGGESHDPRRKQGLLLSESGRLSVDLHRAWWGGGRLRPVRVRAADSPVFSHRRSRSFATSPQSWPAQR